MNFQNKIFLIFALFFLLTGFKKTSFEMVLISDNQNSMKLFQELSRKTGGDVILRDKKKLKEYQDKDVNFISEDLFSGLSSLIFTAEVKLPEGTIQRDFQLDSTLKKLRISVVGTSKIPYLKILDPNKKEVHGKEIFPGENGTKQIFDKLVPGTWSIQIKSDEDVHIVIEGTGTELLANIEPQILVLQMGREGPSYFPVEASIPLVPGKSQNLSLEMDLENHKFSSLNLRLINLSGNLLNEINLGKWDGKESMVEIITPKESFRLMFFGVDAKNGEKIQRMWPKIFLVK